MTPGLDAIIARAVTFTDTISSGSSSYVALMGLFSGKYRSRFIFKDTSHERFLADILAENGYEILLVSQTEVDVFRSSAPIVPVREIIGEQSAKAVVDAVIDTFHRRTDNRPYFLWAHLYEPHYPHWSQDGVPRYGASEKDRYDEEVAFADRHMKRLVDFLESYDPSGNTCFFILADHGTEFEEHGLMYHGINLYQESIHIPLVVLGPSLDPALIAAPVSMIDVAPTVLDLAGCSGSASTDGISLLAFIRDPHTDRPYRFSISGWGDKFCVVDRKGRKMIYDRTWNTYELYDLSSDPREILNIADREPEIALELKRVLYGFILRGLNEYADIDPFRQVPYRDIPIRTW